MRRSLLVLLLFLIVLDVRADCTGANLSVNAATKFLAATFPKAEAPKLARGDEVTLAIGETEFDAIVQDIKSSDLLPTTIIDLGSPESADFEDGVLTLETDISTDAAKLTYTEVGEEKTVNLCLVGQFNTTSQKLDIGPAMADDDEDDDPAAAGTGGDAGDGDDDRPSALRVRYARSYRRFRTTGNNATGRIPSMRNAMQEFSISIDTTDEKDEGFIDDNRVMGGVYTPRVNLGQILNRVRLGAVAQHARAFHGGDHNTDVTLSIDGYIPLFQAFNVGTPQRRLASPFTFRVSAGNRWQNVEGVASDGGVAEWSFLHHVYLFSEYRLDLEHRTVLNDVENRPTSTPRTQHSWKATVLFLGAKDSRFNAVASYENGHSGPVFTQLRQFFVGVGIKDALTGLNK